MNGLELKNLQVRHVGPIDLSIAPGECVETLFMNEKATRHTSLFWVSHDQAQAERVANRWFRLTDNQLMRV